MRLPPVTDEGSFARLERMRLREISFVGLGFEIGQEKQGLGHSPLYARSFFQDLRRHGFHIDDMGDVVSLNDPHNPKVRKNTDLAGFPLDAYRQAHELLLRQSTGPLILNWGGDHSVAIPTVGSFLERHPDGKVIWIDAHADMNIPASSPTGNLHGMPLAVLMNLDGLADHHFPWLRARLRPENILMIGVRDLDPFEKGLIADRGIRVLSSEDVRRRGTADVLREIADFAAASPVHISFDIDSVDPEAAPATGVPVGDGLSKGELLSLGRGLGTLPSVKSLDVVEINPWLARPTEVLATYRLAFRFISSLIQTHGRGAYDRNSQQPERIVASALS